MYREDRFTTIAVLGALTITIAAFVLSHPGLVVFAPEPTDAGPVPVSVEKVAPMEVPPLANPVREIVPAVDADGPSTVLEADFVIGDASVQYADFVAGLCDLGGGLEELPAPQEVLVRTNRDGRTVVADGTHRRYEDFVEVLDGLTVEMIEDMLAEAEVGAGERFATAIDELLAAPVADEDPDMEAKGWYWGFADADYEALTAAQKHMLLMGRENAGIVRARLEVLHDAFSPPGPSPMLTDDSPMTTLIADARPAADPESVRVTP